MVDAPERIWVWPPLIDEMGAAVNTIQQPEHVEYVRADVAEDLSRTGAVKVNRKDVINQIALWSDDEGLDLSMGQGDDLASRILSALEPTRPSEQAVTEAMVEAATEAYFTASFKNTPTDTMRIALNAAMEPSHD